MRRCIRCTLPETFPDIEFDENGLCSICAEFDERKQFIPSRKKLKARFEELLKNARERAGQYHALVALSGGKDSTYLTYLLRKEYGLNVLAFTLDNGFIPKQTFDNIRTVLDKLGVDLMVVKPRADVVSKIYGVSANHDIYPLSLLKCGSSVCVSCIRIVSNLSLRLAIEKKIPLVMLGHSPGQLIQSESEIIYQDNKIPLAFKRRLFQKLADKVGEDVLYYLTLDEDAYHADPFPHTVNPFPLIGYDESVIYETITKLGWVRPKSVDGCSTNCQLNSYGIVKHQERHKFHPYDFEMSQLVRLGNISREEALRRTSDPDGKIAKLAKHIDSELQSKS